MLLISLTIARKPARLTASRLRRCERTNRAKRLRKAGFPPYTLKILAKLLSSFVSKIRIYAQGFELLCCFAPN